MIVLRFMALIAACLLCSCIDSHEEVWIHADGSGRAEVRFSLPLAAAALQGGEAGVEKLVGEFLTKNSALTTSSHEVTTTEDRLLIRVNAEFDSALDLEQLASDDAMEKLPSSAHHLAGETDVRLRGRTVDFKRAIAAGSALPGSMFMPASRFEGHRLVYIMHLPVAAKESNATRIENDGRTLIWDFPLSAAVRKPVSLAFKADMPIPRWILFAGAGAFVVVTWIGWSGIRRFRKPKGT